MAIFESSRSIEDPVLFTPMAEHCQEFGVSKNQRHGIIVAVRFTKKKVFYDILDEYYARIFEKVDATNVKDIIVKKEVAIPDPEPVIPSNPDPECKSIKPKRKRKNKIKNE